nr:neural proliferation differentiation and control protein 1-like [Lytechinus pictus]
MDDISDYFMRAKTYVSTAKESAKEHICNAKEYFYANLQTDSIIQTTSKAQNEADYPAYGVTGPGAQVTPSMNNGDRKLAQSAQMYHYQHQKQQMIAMEKREKGDVARDASDYDSEEENEDGDLTVYECPGLAPTGEMQVKNPLFAEDAYPKQGGDADGEEKQ